MRHAIAEAVKNIKIAADGLNRFARERNDRGAPEAHPAPSDLLMR